MDIDFVIMWVDGSDPAWLAEKKKYTPTEEADDRDERYRDWNLLKYWFRGVEKYAPWVRKIHFVTWGHVPSWLDTDNDKLHIVKHEDFIPEEVRPLFNSSSIECHLHKIPDLAEHFVLFNDDFFITNKLEEKDFFRKGLPCDLLAFQPVIANPDNPVMSHMLLNDSIIISKHFKKRENVWKHPGNYFHIGYPPLYFFYNLLELFFDRYTGFYTVHGPSPFLKESFEDLWSVEKEALASAGANRFRCTGDINQYVFREWQKQKGDFVPFNSAGIIKYFEVGDQNAGLIKSIRNRKRKVVVINDTGKASDVDKVSQEIAEAFESIYPDKSSYEK